MLDVAGILGLDPEGASQKFAERIKELGDKIKPIAQQGMEVITSNISTIWGNQGEKLHGVFTQVTGMLSDGLATGLASIFNQNIKFDFKNTVAQLFEEE